MLVGYALSFAMGIVDTTPMYYAHWFARPLDTPRFEWFAILTILPAALVVIAEHVGHLVERLISLKKIRGAIQVCTVRMSLTACRP